MRRLAAALAAAATLAAGCGQDDAQAGRDATVVVSAAASLKTAFTAYAQAAFPAARFSFAGSDELAAQIRQGVKPDVFAAANTRLPEELHREGLVEEPVVFAANRLVLAVPADAPATITGLDDLARPGVTIAVGAESVPVGAYTRQVLDRLEDRGLRQAILANVRSREPDVAGVVGKIGQGAVDAGFVYVSDVRGAGGRLTAVELPGALQPEVAYAAAVVRGARHAEQARAFVDGLATAAGAKALADAGLTPPPAP